MENSKDNPLKIVIECSNYLFCEAIACIIKEDFYAEIINIFNHNRRHFMNIVDMLKYKPDIIISEFSPEISFSSTIPEELIRKSNVKILLIGEQFRRPIVNKQLYDMVAKGVIGILPSGADSHLLKKAIKAIINDEVWVDRETLLKLINNIKKRDKQITLARREMEIIFHICRGYRNKEIAQKLNISEQTVKSHCNRIYRKLGVSDRLQLFLCTSQMWPEGF